MRNVAFSLAAIGLALPLLTAMPAQAQSLRTWVSGTGNDNSSDCNNLAPCKTFAGALAKTAAGGEIICFNAGDFGPVTINKSVTISCEAGTAGILQGGSSNAAILIDAGTTDIVTLRGLDLEGRQSGGYGINVSTAKEVHIENCSIRDFVVAGIATPSFSSTTVFLYVVDTMISSSYVGVLLASSGGYKVASLKNVAITGSTYDGVNLNASNAFVNVTDSIISANGGSAVDAAAANTTANIKRTTIANNGIAGLYAAASGSAIRVSSNSIYNNTNGFLIAAGATIQSDGTNKTGSSNGGAGAPNASLTRQ
jgi:hypothetical protein